MPKNMASTVIFASIMWPTKCKAQNPYLSSNTNLADKAKNFNSFFALLAKNSKKNLPKQQNIIFQPKKKCIPSSIFLESPNVNEIAECIIT